jgi:Ribbon-helix-helix protein, copG family
MRRTNIYLAEEQSAAVEDVARARGISRAELIRQLIDSGLSGTGSADLEADLAAIDESFGILSDSGDFPARGDDDRARHLDRVARLAKTR